MRKSQDINREYQENEKIFAQVSEEHHLKQTKLRNEMLQHARYSVGQRVCYSRYARDIEWTPGIIRGIIAENVFNVYETQRHELRIYYYVAKITANGKAHKTQDICSTTIPEGYLYPEDSKKENKSEDQDSGREE